MPNHVCVNDVRRCCIAHEPHIMLCAPPRSYVVFSSQLCQIGYPWQYKQPAFVQSKLWVANFLLRTMFLNKLFPKFYGQQVSQPMACFVGVG